MLDWSQCLAVERHPDRVSGAWVFRGTRVPVRALFENLESGARLEEFLDWFPGVAREQAEAVLEHAARSLQDIDRVQRKKDLTELAGQIRLRDDFDHKAMRDLTRDPG
jgi:uncharacterized protein (DUF433 family)